MEKNKQSDNTTKSSSNKTAKSNKKKRKKTVISHITKPEKMTLEEWQIKLR